MTGRRKRSPAMQNLALAAASTLIGGLLALVGAEIWFRLAERNVAAATDLSADCRWIADAELGYRNPSSKRCQVATTEFRYGYNLNADGHPDLEYDPSPGLCTVLVVGDSHTFAVGVPDQETWPNVLERELRKAGSPPIQVMNTAVAGYGLGQEYLMAMRHLERYRAQHLVIGFSLATDAYDIRTPADGGFIYGGQFPRKYFDLADGRLVLKDPPPAIEQASGTSAPVARPPAWSSRMKDFLREHSALVRATSRGAIGQYAARLLRFTGSNPWPSAESVVAKELDPVDAKSWQLVDRILESLQERLRSRGVGLSIVVIPYLPQVYDEVWNRAFGTEPKYDRFAGNGRIRALCERHQIHCIDVTRPLIDEARQRKRWLHYPQDAHPTPEGQAFIAAAVMPELRSRIKCATR